ncbi:MAG: heavy metal translocating P-type ATPase [Gammaproteobacteria bacterium]|nr:heavy metal translocating P-type ATPase [Gammaproteobacteria bacterium]MBU1556606.1 heavy metal translocating P-type ATPase [Gammaproteobacteria bacterium]MBU2069737.1 heavy metal translocating P-type ATPase [Gammaproteobacteria bacterium]MBU2184602.1 heavy metal translocating P-type ATPase [Gammaproteobacteria bacterium]MBU2205732.1 heavy metal translocating P-type ATPase [Gammaproteobacteria bacterium]
MNQITLSISGMHCGSCVGKVEKILQAVPGVSTATVNLATEQAQVEGSAATAELLAALQRGGYQAQALTAKADNQAVMQHKTAEKQTEQALLLRDLWLAAVLTLPVFVLEMGAHLIPAFHHWLMAALGQSLNWQLQALLTTLVLLGPGRRFITTGIPLLLKGQPEMNSLVALGTLSAWGFSLLATFMPQLLPQGTAQVYFEAAAVIVTLILLGRYLEARAKGQTGAAIQQLLSLQPVTATLLKDGVQLKVALAKIMPGDLLLVHAGERIALDAVVVQGTSYIDESMLTGEPVAKAKQPDDAVYAGTVNKQGVLQLRVSKAAGDTVLAQIINLVQQAQSGKLPIQALVDKVTAIFVPLVIVLALITFSAWIWFSSSLSLALVNAVAVLIIACPCAMGLATPTSIMVGTGRAAQLGILFRKGSALQTLQDCKVIALDKTGTLTLGKPQLTDTLVETGFSAEHVLALAAALEQQSEHPLAEALVSAAAAQQLDLPAVNDVKVYSGMGLSGMVNAQHVAIGADRFMQQLKLDVSAKAAQADALSASGKTVLYLAVDHQLAAMLAVADTLKPGSLDAIAAMHRLGLKVAMVSGDNRHTANAIAQQLNIDTVVAEVLPQGKVDAVKQLRQQYGALAFVGDGINDAPALAEADIGLAVGNGTDIAIEAADVVLMHTDVMAVLSALSISRATLRNIRQNLFWAFGYNALLLPVAAGVLYPAFGILLSPMLAAGAMALSSVFVVTNALRLRGLAP